MNESTATSYPQEGSKVFITTADIDSMTFAFAGIAAPESDSVLLIKLFSTYIHHLIARTKHKRLQHNHACMFVAHIIMMFGIALNDRECHKFFVSLIRHNVPQP